MNLSSFYLVTLCPQLIFWGIGIDIIKFSNDEITLKKTTCKSWGAPGSVNIEEGAIISAWLHEYQHFCDDRNAGYLGFRVFQNLQKCAEREIRAYKVENWLRKA